MESSQISTLDARVVAPAGSAPSWRERHWFPVASVHELDPLRPTPVVIDGLALVVWHVPEKQVAGKSKRATLHAAPNEEGWRVFADVCPHRLAPLSEGRVEPETGCLQCAYHGWEFDDAGKCKQIPSADIESCTRACGMQRSSALSYPCKVAFKVLWAWLGEAEPKSCPSELFKGSPIENEMVFNTYTRDLPYGYDTLVENLMDVSHIPFAHHGLQGSRKDATPISLQVHAKQAGSIEFSFDDRTMGMGRHSDFTMLLPFLAFYRGKFDKPGKSPFKLNFLCIPVAPGKSRLILLYTDPPGKGHRSMLQRFPVWVVHLFSNRFLDSDLCFLHYQERILRSAPRSADKWQNGYFMPAKCDQSINAWRRWLDREGARCVAPEYTLPDTPTRDMLLNRFEQHTQHCKHCQAALEGIDRWQSRAGKIGVIALALDRLKLGPSRLWLALQVLAIGTITGLQAMKPSFHFVDYKHYLK